MNQKSIRTMMCDEACRKDSITRKWREVNPLACAECESMCLGGVEYLKRMKEDDFRELLCGADCDTCRQPCNLWRIALMRKIKPHVIRRREKPKCRTWLEIAMRPYLERRMNGSGMDSA